MCFIILDTQARQEDVMGTFWQELFDDENTYTFLVTTGCYGLAIVEAAIALWAIHSAFTADVSGNWTGIYLGIAAVTGVFALAQTVKTVIRYERW